MFVLLYNFYWLLGNCGTASLIENKVGAEFQPMQAQRYSHRIHLWVIGNSISCRSCIRLSKNPPFDKYAKRNRSVPQAGKQLLAWFQQLVASR